MNAGKKNNPYYQAQAILSRREHTEFEIRMKMKRKKFSDAEIDEVVGKLKKLKLIDDGRFAVLFVSNTLTFKPVGPRWLQYKLKIKGIKPAVIEGALAQAYPSDKEEELAQKAAKLWRRSHPRYKDDSNRLQRYLISRGFSHQVMVRVRQGDSGSDS